MREGHRNGQATLPSRRRAIRPPASEGGADRLGEPVAPGYPAYNERQVMAPSASCVEIRADTEREAGAWRA